MNFSLFTKKFNFKGLLFVFGIALIISGIWYSHQLIDILEDDATDFVRFRIRVLEANINNPDANTDIDFLFNDVIKNADYPAIYADTENMPRSWKNISPEIDEIKSLRQLSKKDSTYLFEQFQRMARENKPIPIKYQNTIVLGYYYYGFSPVIYKLRLFPFIAIGAAILFILLGYIGFSYIKRSEERFIWVGMAKETAHQLGTPLSSISGWLELLLLDSKNRNIVITEVQNDLKRLNKIANRFSKIGSIPALKPVLLNQTIENVVSYFQKRLPNLNKKITLEANFLDSVSVKLNEELFEWVLENLIKNALDASENSNGLIKITVEPNPDKGLVFIDVYDNGKGINPKNKKNVFKPGYSTKKRGWGLGLSLARRIIEEYHGGKLLLKDSKSGKGTTFRIILNLG